VLNSTNLYLDFEIDFGSPADAKAVLAAAIDAGAISSVLLRSGDGGSLDTEAARALVQIAHKHDIAVLVASTAEEAARLGADGVHVRWSTDIVPAFKAVRGAAPTLIVGADAGRTRHDAMELGEAGADYVAFGIPPHVEDREKAGLRQRDLIAWWSEVFEVPCVALDIPNSEDAHSLALAGADFVGVHVRTSEGERAAAERIRAFSDAVRMTEPAK
jgi:thiamine-phosphate pyrophosphorylase